MATTLDQHSARFWATPVSGPYPPEWALPCLKMTTPPHPWHQPYYTLCELSITSLRWSNEGSCRNVLAGILNTCKENGGVKMLVCCFPGRLLWTIPVGLTLVEHDVPTPACGSYPGWRWRPNPSVRVLPWLKMTSQASIWSLHTLEPRRRSRAGGMYSMGVVVLNITVMESMKRWASGSMWSCSSPKRSPYSTEPTAGTNTEPDTHSHEPTAGTNTEPDTHSHWTPIIGKYSHRLLI